jgi:hypothetical protein
MKHNEYLNSKMIKFLRSVGVQILDDLLEILCLLLQQFFVLDLILVELAVEFRVLDNYEE